MGLAVGAALWAALLVLHWVYLLLMFNAYHLACSTPTPARRALPRIAAVSAIVVATESARSGDVEVLDVVFYGAVTAALGLFVAMIQAIHAQSEERSRLIATLEATREELAVSERRAGALAERQRMARDIHDTLAQGFASIVTLCEAARAELASSPDAALRRLDEIGRTARSSLSEARRVVWALRPEALKRATLAEALERLARDLRSETGVDATSRIVGEPRAVDAEAEATLLRVAQESLANVRKHARANRVAITLTYLDDALLLDVRDDGVGFDAEKAFDERSAAGLGLTGMRERIGDHGGALTVESAPGCGTTIAVALPDRPAVPADEEGQAGVRSDPTADVR